MNSRQASLFQAEKAQKIRGRVSLTIDPEARKPIRPRELPDRSPETYNPLVSSEAVSAPRPVKPSRTRAIAFGEVVARRAAREQRTKIVAFLRAAGLEGEVVELANVEQRLRQRSERDLVHAAFSTRILLHAVADALFPACNEPWQDREGRQHKVGEEEVANRISAYVQKHLGPSLESCEQRAFQGELDALKRWTGRGPHGAHSPEEADQSYVRLLSVLTVVARAHDFVASTAASRARTARSTSTAVDD